MFVCSFGPADVITWERMKSSQALNSLPLHTSSALARLPSRLAKSQSTEGASPRLPSPAPAAQEGPGPFGFGGWMVLTHPQQGALLCKPPRMLGIWEWIPKKSLLACFQIAGGWDHAVWWSTTLCPTWQTPGRGAAASRTSAAYKRCKKRCLRRCGRRKGCLKIHLQCN